MQAKGGIAIIVVLLLIGAGIFFMQNNTVTAPASETVVSEVTETATTEPTEMAATEKEPSAWEPAAGDTETTPAAEAAAEETATEATETTAAADDAAVEEAVPAETTAPAQTAAPAQESLLAAPKSLVIDVQDAMLDRVLGNLDAPITIIEYASMTCPHCAHFHNTMLNDVKRELLIEGKAKLVFRDYPLDKYAMSAAMMARCAPDGKYFDLVEVIFRNQDRWMKAESPLQALAKLGNLAGMDDEYIAACMQNAELRNAIAANQMEGQRLYQVRSTPTFIFNTQKNDNVKSLSGVDNSKEIIDTANKLLNMR